MQDSCFPRLRNLHSNSKTQGIKVTRQLLSKPETHGSLQYTLFSPVVGGRRRQKWSPKVFFVHSGTSRFSSCYNPSDIKPRALNPYMYYSLNSLKEGYVRDLIYGATIGVIEGYTRRLDSGSHIPIKRQHLTFPSFIRYEQPASHPQLHMEVADGNYCLEFN